MFYWEIKRKNGTYIIYIFFLLLFSIIIFKFWHFWTYLSLTSLLPSLDFYLKSERQWSSKPYKFYVLWTQTDMEPMTDMPHVSLVTLDIWNLTYVRLLRYECVKFHFTCRHSEYSLVYFEAINHDHKRTSLCVYWILMILRLLQTFTKTCISYETYLMT